MKLMNMKQEPNSKPMDCCAMPDKPAYPYGLKIRLEEADLKKLGIKELPEVGQTVKIEAVAEICDVSYNESNLYGENRCIVVQITDLGLSMGAAKSDKKEDKDEY